MISPEKSPGPNHGKNYWGRQLSLDQLATTSPWTQGKVADKTHSILTGEMADSLFKIDELSDNTFSIRLPYNGRSYRLRGIYVVDQIRSPYWWDMSASMIRIVRFDNILACRDGRYTVPVPHGRERETLQESARTILSGHYNGTMH